MPDENAVTRILDELARHHAGSMCFTPVSESLLSVLLCSDLDGEHEFLELDGDSWRQAYESLRGTDRCVVVNAAGDVRTW